MLREESKARYYLWCILAVTAVVYLRCLANAFVLDDVVMQVKNPDLRDWSFLWKAFTRSEFWYSEAGFIQVQQYRNYRPILNVWYWVDYHLFGLHPAPWHASIVMVHLVAVWLVFKICRRLANDSTAALIAAAAFALTPIHAGAVVWLAACGMVIGSSLTLGAFYLIMPRADGTATTRNWAAAILLYAGALLSHESMAVFPAIVACYAFLFDDADSPPTASIWMRASRAVIWQLPFAVELVLYFIARRLALGFFLGNPNDLQNTLTGAQAVLTVPLVLATYLYMLVMPWLTLPNHAVLPVSSPLSPEFWVPIAAIAVAVAVFLVFALRSPRRGFYLFCAAWIGVTLTPMMMLHSVPHLVQDYCLYLPSVGWCILLGDLIARVARINLPARRLAFAGASAMLIVYAVVLWKQEWFWHDDVAASEGYVEGSPESVAWHWNLANHLDQRGDFTDAEREIRTAIRLEPDRTGITHPHSKQLHHFLGELLARRGDIEGAELEIGKSVNCPADENEVHPAYDPHAAFLYFQGLNDAKAGRIDQGIREVAESLDIMKRDPRPEYGPIALLYVRLAELYDLQGNEEQVEAVLREVDSMPEGELAVGLARAKIRLNHSDNAGAERILRDLSERYPTNDQVLNMLGDLDFKSKRYEEALDCYQRAKAGWYGDARQHLSIAQSLHAIGREREAIAQCRLAQALSPQDLAVRFSCAAVGKDVESK
jgi:Flp pilus assembly protein TadD